MPTPTPRRFLLRWCAWYFLGTGALFALLALRYLAVAPLATGFASGAFRASMFVTQASLLALALLLLATPVVLLVPLRRVVVPFAVLLALVVLVVVLVDTFVYQQYRFHLDASVWRLLTDGGAESTFHMPRSTHIAFGGIVLGFLVVLVAWAFAAWRWTEYTAGRRLGRAVVGVLALVLLAHNGAHVWASAAAYTPITQQVAVLPLHQPVTANRTLRKLGIEVARAPYVPGEAPSGLRYPREPLAFQPPARPENVCFLVVDSWRADALTARATPNLAALAEQSVRFENHHSGGNATRVGMFSLFYGLPGTYWHDVLAERRVCVLVEEFQKKGYEIAVFTSAPLYSPEFDETIFSGVPNLRRESQGRSPAECDRDLTDDFLAWLAARDASRPFLTLLFYDAPHAYDVPPDFPREFEPSWPHVDYLGLDADTDPVPFHNLYLNSVRWSDAQAGRAIDGLRAAGVIDDTCLVVTGDHGQEFNDLGLAYWGHNSNYARFQTQVPLLIRRRGLAPGVRTHLTTHFDVVATLLPEILGCTNPPEDYCVGRNLFDTADRGVLTLATYSTYAAVRPGMRHVVVGKSGDIQVLGRDYRPEPGLDSDADFLKQAFQQRARFRPGAAGAGP
ncbi:MAG: DUF3413 domain-containing protein [Planctomycetota bacterium]|nr:DUF3413 domain-containing protein [Planctomycetota bacterium]